MIRFTVFISLLLTFSHALQAEGSNLSKLGQAFKRSQISRPFIKKERVRRDLDLQLLKSAKNHNGIQKRQVSPIMALSEKTNFQKVNKKKSKFCPCKVFSFFSKLVPSFKKNKTNKKVNLQQKENSTVEVNDLFLKLKLSNDN